MRLLGAFLVLGAVGQAAAAAWDVDVSAALYALPDDEDLIQPTVRADREDLHLEARDNYEDRNATSLFLGANFAWGEEKSLALTPMLGVLFGDIHGLVPGLEADFGAGLFQAYTEAEYVMDLEDSASSYVYAWSELSLRPWERWRAGLVGQRTRAYQTDRDIQRGVLLGLAFPRIEGTVYLFNPGSGDHFTVVSLSLSF